MVGRRLRIELKDYDDLDDDDDNEPVPLKRCAFYIGKKGEDWQAFLTDGQGRLCAAPNTRGEIGRLGLAGGDRPAWLAIAAGRYQMYYSNYYYA
ncbi:hypothetical protein ACFL59_00975 [Planctomycetota bacterium]